ncbi:MAG: glycogen/starch synthase [Cytophagales bacterium]
MLPKKILYLVIELDPFLQLTSDAFMARNMVEELAGRDLELRVIGVKFRRIRERKNRIHEVQRLCGINIPIGSKNVSLVVKVAPIAKTRVQSYFIDNEDFFCHKGIFHNDEGVFYPDNHERIPFICKSPPAILDNLKWGPDLIHCIGWPWSLASAYLRVAFKNSFLIKNTKIIHTYGASLFKDAFDFERLKRGMMPKITDTHLAPMNQKGDIGALIALSKAYSDKVFCTFQESDTEAHKMFKKFDVPFIPHDKHMVSAYHKIYKELLQ